MKTLDLKKILNRVDEDMDIHIAARGPNTAVGPTPTVKLKSASCGIDWDRSRFMLWAEKPLFHSAEDLKKKARLIDDLRYLSQRHDQGDLNDGELVDVIKRKLDSISRRNDT
jgi:hypothetical protein